MKKLVFLFMFCANALLGMAQSDSSTIKTIWAIRAIRNRPDAMEEDQAERMVVDPGRIDSILVSKKIIFDNVKMLPFLSPWKVQYCYQHLAYLQSGEWKTVRNSFSTKTSPLASLFFLVLMVSLFLVFLILSWIMFLFDRKEIRLKDFNNPSSKRLRLRAEQVVFSIFRHEIAGPLMISIGLVVAVKGNGFFWVSYAIWLVLIIGVNYFIRNYLIMKNIKALAHKLLELKYERIP